jgi:hypothetical protein
MVDVQDAGQGPARVFAHNDPGAVHRTTGSLLSPQLTTVVNRRYTHDQAGLVFRLCLVGLAFCFRLKGQLYRVVLPIFGL